jgi:hypothetical protein
MQLLIIKQFSDESSICRDMLLGRYLTIPQILTAAASQFPSGAIVHYDVVSDITTTSKSSDPGDVQAQYGFKSTIVRVIVDYSNVSKSDVAITETYEASSLQSIIHQKVNKPMKFNGVSLYSLLHLGAMKPLKTTLFRLFFELPIWQLPADQQRAVSPWNVFISLKPSNEGKIPCLRLRYYMDNPTNDSVGVTMGYDGLMADRASADVMFSAITSEFKLHEAELAQGRFSFVEYDSGYGYLSARMAKRYPNATVISLEQNPSKTKYHYDMVTSLGIKNNAICTKGEENYVIYRNVHDSPELFRYQIKLRGLIDEFVAAYSLPSAGSSVLSSSKYSSPDPSNWDDITGIKRHFNYHLSCRTMYIRLRWFLTWAFLMT